MKRLIVNADDFGLTTGVNQAIIEAFDRGILTSASLMVGGPAFKEAVRLAKERPDLGIGVHLTLVNGQPVSAPDLVSSLVGPDGTFYHSPIEFVARLRLGRIRIEDLERELRAQIGRAIEAGLRVTHVDGHKHLHVHPAVLDVVIKVMREFEISRMRLPLESPNSMKRAMRGNPHLEHSKNQPLPARRTRVVLQVLSHLFVWLAARSGKRKLIEARIGFPETFFGLFDTGSISEPLLQAILENLPDGTSEIMCHPGYDDDQLRSIGTRLTSQREQELRALTSQAVRDLIEKTGIELINYGNIV